MLTARLVTQSTAPEREVDVSRPPSISMTSRKWCASCMQRKTVWLVEYGPFCKNTVCWKCMGPAVRRAFREGY